MSRPRSLLLLILCVGVAIGAHRPLRRTAYRILRWPLTLAETALSAVVWLPDVPALSRQQTEFRTAFAAQHVELIRLRDTVRQLTRANELKGQAPSAVGPVAAVIGRTIIPTQHVIILNRGARQGVTLQSLWLDVDGVVGRTIEAQPTTSLVMLLTDPDSRVAAMVERSRESGLLIGTGGSWCQLVYLDLEADVAVGDRVVTAGLGSVFPKGLTLGTVTKVVRRESESTTLAWVKPAVRLNRLEDIICLLPPAPSS